MKFKRILSGALFVAMLCTMLTSCGSNPTTSNNGTSGDGTSASQSDSTGFDSADSPSYELKLGHVQTSTHSYHIGAMYFAEQIEERSGGKIKVDVYPSSQLGSERDLVEGVQMGTLDMAIVGVGVLANFDPSFEIFNLPFLFNDREHAYKVLGGEFGAEKFKQLEQFDIVGLGYYENGFFDILSNKKVEVPSDAAGLNIRTMENAVYMGIFQAIGANPVPMAFSEVYTALQNGTVDGASVSITALTPTKFHEVASNFAILDMCFTPTPLIMSKEILSGMPESYQELIREVAAESVTVQWDETVRQEEEAKKEMEAAGCVINTVQDRQAWIDAIVDTVYAQVADIVPQEDIDAVRNAA